MRTKQFLFDTVSIWFPLFIVITLISGLAYALSQQMQRMGANDPQIQMAEDTANQLADGVTINTLDIWDKVDIGKSLSPFVMVFDSEGKVLSSQAELNAQIPTPPEGVFNYTRTHGTDTFTWQPEKNVRIAAVVQYFSGDATGFVLSGRSLREIEKRDNNALLITAVVWFIASSASLGSVVVLNNLKRKFSS